MSGKRNQTADEVKNELTQNEPPTKKAKMQTEASDREHHAEGYQTGIFASLLPARVRTLADTV